MAASISNQSLGEMMRIGARNCDAGLFSHLNFVVTHIDTLGHAAFHVDWTDGNPYVSGESGNVFDKLFIQSLHPSDDDPLIEEWPHHRYTGANADGLYRGSSKWRWHLHHCWKLLRVRKQILDDAASFADAWAADATALHVRNSKIGVECPGNQAPTLEDYGRIPYGGEEPVYLATDNEEAVEYFSRLLGSRLKIRDIPRSADMNTEFHLTSPQSVNDARECLIDALIMARCARLLHSVSNIATAVLYMNPKIPHVYVIRGGVLYLPPSSEDESLKNVRKLVARGNPSRVIHLNHPKWLDWGLVYEERVVVRHTTGCAGALLAGGNGEIEIRWLDWEPEVYTPQLGEDRRLGSSPFPLYYNMRKGRRIEVALCGGLGNQMFQYAFGLHLARRLRAELVLFHDGRNRSFALGMFGLGNQLPDPRPDATLEWNEDYECGLEEVMVAALSVDGPVTLRIQGWFQNEKFFLPVADEVRKRFEFRLPLPSYAKDRIAVAVHVRLGDYQRSAGHRPLPALYYDAALSEMRSKVDDPLFIVFSDDPHLCPERLRGHPDVVILPQLNDFQAFGMMMSCDAFVIANSTFSWWAAWLSRSTRVICPDSFLPGRKWTICPERWHQIPVSYGNAD